MKTLVRRALVEVCTVLVLLVIPVFSLKAFVLLATFVFLLSVFIVNVT